MKKNNSVLLSTPYILWMVVFTLIPLGVVAYYALTDPATGAKGHGNPLHVFLPEESSVHGILQARILEWVAMPSSRGSSQPRDQTQVSYVAG